MQMISWKTFAKTTTGALLFAASMNLASVAHAATPLERALEKLEAARRDLEVGPKPDVTSPRGKALEHVIAAIDTLKAVAPNAGKSGSSGSGEKKQGPKTEPVKNPK